MIFSILFVSPLNIQELVIFVVVFAPYSLYVFYVLAIYIYADCLYAVNSPTPFMH